MNRIRRTVAAVGLTLLLAVGATVGLGGCNEPTFTNKKGITKTEQGWKDFAAKAAENGNYPLAIVRTGFAEEVREGIQCEAELVDYQRLHEEKQAAQVFKIDPSVARSRAFFKGLKREGNFALYPVGRGDNPSVVAARLEAAIDGVVYKPARVEEESLYASPEWIGIMETIECEQMGAEGWTEGDPINYDSWKEGDVMEIPYLLIGQIK